VCSVFRCPDVITVHREVRARFRKDVPHKDNVSIKQSTKLTLHAGATCSVVPNR
jgi:hypothetical protein